VNISIFGRALNGMQRFALLGAVLLLAANTACAASFDCAKASTKVEKMICADPELSKLDEDLSATYSKALKESSDAATLKQQQREWMKGRNGCADAQCVKRSYEQRLSSLSGSGASMDGSQSAKQAYNQRYHFQLTKGAGTPVCDAYLERLNITKYKSPPYCGRPENDSVKGFVKLNRVPLSPKDVHDIYPIIFAYEGKANQKDINWNDMKFQKKLVANGQFVMTEAEAKALQMSMDSDWAKIWGYSPPIDIDNDRAPENVEIWYGTVARGPGGTLCGESPFVHPDAPPVRLPQIAFVVSNDGKRLDVVKTEKVFAHPSGGYRAYDEVNQRWVTFSQFRPVGDSIGIFKFRDLYYFDTFFDKWGDFEDKRYGWDDPLNKRLADTGEGKSYDKNIINTLAVFLHKDGETKQICEYLMTDQEAQGSGGSE